MNIVCETKSLNAALKLARQVRERNSVSSLAFVAISTKSLVVGTNKKKRGITLGATNLVVDIVANVAGEVVVDGTVGIDCDVLCKIAASAKDDTITIVVEGAWAAVTHGRARYRVPCLDADKLPRFGAHGSKLRLHHESPTDLHELLRRTSYAVSSDATRAHLCGVLIEGDGKVLRAVATDGHRLSTHEVESTWELAPSILPDIAVRAFSDALASAELAEIGLDQERIVLRADDVTLSAKRVDMAYPTWRAVLPNSSREPLIVDAAAMRAAITRSLLLATNTHGVLLSLRDGALHLGVDRNDGAYAEVIEVENADGREFRVALNPRYVLDWLQATPCDSFALSVGGELEPVLLQAGDASRGVVMPMKF